MNFIKSHLGVILPIAVTVLTLAVTVAVLLVIKPWAPIEAVSSSAPSSSSEVSEESSSEEDSSSEDLTSSLPEEPEIELAVTVPASTDITVNTPYYTIKGSYDPAYPITINGVELTTDGSGLLAHSVELAAGPNYYTVTHKDKTVSFVIRYKKVVIKSVSPASALRVESLAQCAVSCIALRDSTVTATWNGQTVTLYPDDNEGGATEGEYQTYLGGFTAPTNTGAAKSYGKVSFTVPEVNVHQMISIEE